MCRCTQARMGRFWGIIPTCSVPWAWGVATTVGKMIVFAATNLVGLVFAIWIPPLVSRNVDVKGAKGNTGSKESGNHGGHGFWIVLAIEGTGAMAEGNGAMGERADGFVALSPSESSI